MKILKQKLILSVFVVLSLFVLVGNGWSQQVGRPHALFEGFMATYLDGSASGLPYDLEFFDTVITGVILNDGSTPYDPIIGATVELTTTRSFSGISGSSFNNGTIKITNGVTTYLSATLNNINFTTDGVQWFLNPGLDINHPETLNLSNILLTPNGSAYIQELATSLGNNTIAGMQITLDVFDGDITQDSYSFIQGLFDGVPASTNTPPNANAGDNITITSALIASTIINGVVGDGDGDALLCSWMEGATVLKNWTSAGSNGECPLNLSSFSLGTHTLTLKVDDGHTITSDDMILTVDNSAPHAAPGATSVINYIVTLQGDVSDYDGDSLYYEWLEGTNVFCSGNIQSIALGYPVMLPPCVVSGLSLGTHTISLQVRDVINSPDRKDVTVEIIDTSAPTISPVASAYIMWPPNHIMVNIAIDANAFDNSGLPVALNVAVTSNEPEDGLGDGDTGPFDWTQPVIDQNTGRIDLQLRRERSGSGTGRVYTIFIIATDSSGNTSTAKVNITVPHDMGNKK